MSLRISTQAARFFESSDLRTCLEVLRGRGMRRGAKPTLKTFTLEADRGFRFPVVVRWQARDNG